jgi:predicted deacylase
LVAKELIDCDLHMGSRTCILYESLICHIPSKFGGILKKHISVGDEVNEGDMLCEIFHPLEGHTIDRIMSPISGTIFFSHNKQLVMEHTELFMIIPPQ